MAAPPQAALWMAMLSLQLYASLAYNAQSTMDCGLPGMIPKAKRKNIKIAGKEVPVGQVDLEWSSGYVGTHLVRFIASEILGYNTIVAHSTSGSIPAFLSTAGCVNTEDIDKADCSPAPFSRIHMAWEAWGGGNSFNYEKWTKKLKALAPVNAGLCGYSGIEGEFVKESILKASEADKWPVAYYKTLNASWHDVTKYFNSYTDIPDADVMPCEKSRMTWSKDMVKYATVTGDQDGLEKNAKGDSVAKCVTGQTTTTDGGRWFLTPACRKSANPKKCIPFLSGGTGWSIDAAMQKMTAWDVPAALGVTANWGTFLRIPRDYKTFMYWWKPDLAFIDIAAEQITWPANDRAAWIAGDKRTRGSSTETIKFMNLNLKWVANDLDSFYRAMSVTSTQMDDILLDIKLHAHADGKLWPQNGKASGRRCNTTSEKTVASQMACQEEAVASKHDFYDFNSATKACHTAVSCDSISNVAGDWKIYEKVTEVSAACRWLHKNEPLWRKWVPDPTACQPSSGLVDSNGAYVKNKADAVSCKSCGPGTASNMSDDKTTFTCEKCAAGSFAEAFRSEACTPCAPGTFASAEGQKACLPCPPGTYTNVSGSSACTSCGEGRTTFQKVGVEWVLRDGAVLESSCGCAKGRQNDANGKCVPCGEGLSCAGKGTVVIEPGYASDGGVSAYKCYKMKSRCPGGAPGICAIGRKAESIACSLCETGKTPQEDGTCGECAAGGYVSVAFAVIFFFSFLTAVYILNDRQTFLKQSSSVLVIGTIGAQMFATLQSVGVLTMISIPWQEPLASLLPLCALFVFDVSLLSPNCIVEVDPITKYLFRLMLIFICFVYLVTVHIFAVVVFGKMNFKRKMPSVISAVGTIFFAFFLSIVSTVLSTFHCNGHPNGKTTLASQPDLLCFEGGEHTTFIGLSVGALVMPISYLSVAAWVMYVFPARIRAADRYFLQCFGFMFFRFRPGAYWYGPVILARNTMLSIGPIFSTVIIQVYYLLLVLILSFASILYTKPWKHPLCNWTDTVGLFVMTLLIATSLAFINVGDDAAGLSQFMFAMMVFALAVPLLMVGYGFYMMYQAAQKPFEYFLCHYKEECGSFARFLKTVLETHPQVRRKVFIDSDDLTDLAKLFDYVSTQTETMVILHSRGLLQRLWCVGELTTAWEKRVNTIRVTLSGVETPTEEFITTYSSIVPNVEDLFQYGKTLSDIQAALRWFTGQSRVGLPKVLTEEVFASLANSLVAFCASRKGSGAFSDDQQIDKTTSGELPHDLQVVILADIESTEAMCTAMVICQNLVKISSGEQMFVPKVLRSEHSLPTKTLGDAIIICTAGVFDRKFTLETLITFAEIQARPLPILSDDAFRFPDAQFLEDIRPVAERFELDPQIVLPLISQVFKQIAVVCNTSQYSTTKAVLDAKIQEIKLRLSKGQASGGHKMCIEAKGPDLVFESKASMEVHTSSSLRMMADVSSTPHEDDDTYSM